MITFKNKNIGRRRQHNGWRLWTTGSDRRTPFRIFENTGGKTTV